MKNTIVAMAGILLFSASVKAQQTWDPAKNPTVDSIRAKYADKMIAPKPAPTIDQVFPVLGQYQSSTNMDAANVTITIDEMNKGVVWITGLPQGKVKAMLKKSPATYRIPAQAAEDGKQIPEGTLIYDKDANQLNIVIGKKYNEMDPASVFLPEPEPVVEEAPVKTTKTKTKTATTKTKTKVEEVVAKPWMYTGNKIEKPAVAMQ
jgi:hypothetical protein